MWEASWFAEVWAKYTPSLDTGCNVPFESPCYRRLVGFFIFLLLTLLNFSYIIMNTGKPNLQVRERKPWPLLLWQKGFLGFHDTKL